MIARKLSRKTCRKKHEFTSLIIIVQDILTNAPASNASSHHSTLKIKPRDHNLSATNGIVTHSKIMAASLISFCLEGFGYDLHISSCGSPAPISYQSQDRIIDPFHWRNISAKLQFSCAHCNIFLLAGMFSQTQSPNSFTVKKVHVNPLMAGALHLSYVQRQQDPTTSLAGGKHLPHMLVLQQEHQSMYCTGL